MGDRANVVIEQGPGRAPVWLYSHWGGKEFQEAVWKAAQSPAAQDRIADPGYYTRIIVSQTIDSISGIGTAQDDNEHRIMVIDAMTGERRFEEDPA